MRKWEEWEKWFTAGVILLILSALATSFNRLIGFVIYGLATYMLGIGLGIFKKEREG